jgi:hypothetical protein
MSKFNQKSTTKTENFAGGEAYKQSPELELISILLTSFAQDQYYRSANDTFKQLDNLIVKVDPEFSAKAAIYSRTEFGMRSISHVIASKLAKQLGRKTWAKKFYENIIYRPDDMTEIIAYHFAENQKLSASMKKGFANAFNKFDAYQLAKYRGENKAVKLVDVVNLVHPKGNDKNSEALKLLVDGKLVSENTWETELTQAGQKAESKEQKDKLKKDAWSKLIKEHKLGYFALLRNLRNITEQAPEVLTDALKMLTDEKLIKKSLVLPFRFVTAIEEIKKLNTENVRDIIIALNKALDISCNNVPIFDGKTIVVVDFSGSMGEGLKSCRGQASLLGSILAKSNNSDFMIFGNHSEYVNFNPMDSILTIVEYMNGLNNYYGGNSKHNVGHGTNFHSIFETLNKSYDRIIILSDMQGWIGYNSPVSKFNEYKNRFNTNPYIYSFDLNSYGSMQFPEQNVFCLAGFSEKIFDIMKLLETDKKALINKINNIEL